MTCQCEIAGFCPVLKRQMTVRHWLICQGEALDEKKCEQMRQNWLAIAVSRETGEPIKSCCGKKDGPQRVERKTASQALE